MTYFANHKLRGLVFKKLCSNFLSETKNSAEIPENINAN